MLVRVMVAFDTAAERRRAVRLVGVDGTVSLEAHSRRDLWAQLTHQDIDLVVVGRALLPTPPDAFVSSIRELPEHPDVIVVSDREDPIERAGLLAAGCLAVLLKSLPDGSLSEAFNALVARRRETERSAARVGVLADQSRLSDFVSESPAMRDFMTVVRRVVDTHSPLLVLGETGVGKERLARAIHTAGPRSSGPFVPLNCGALPEGLLETELFGHELGAFTGATRSRKGYFELSHGGTIFLDEIGELPLHLQVKLLRVLEERNVRRVGSERPLPIDVRVIAATNRHLEAEVEAKRFRADLYYRLAVVTLVVPPLRDRREDIPALLASYLEHFRTHLRRPASAIAPEALDVMLRYGWPGNVRELINVVERAVLLSEREVIALADLPPNIAKVGRRTRSPAAVSEPPQAEPAPLPIREARERVVAEFEHAYLTDLLRATRGRIGETARRAGVDARSIHTLMKRHGLKKESFKVPRTR